jgi:hypothetical protein
MKKLVKQVIIAAGFLFCNVAFAQVAPPAGINYQAVARDNSGSILANNTLSIRISILNAINGAPQFQETHTVTTNQFGLFNIVIGQGTFVTGPFNSLSTIPWGSSNYFAKIEANPGTGYIDMGTMQLWSVPYALYSGSSTNPGPTGPTGVGTQGPAGPAGPTGVGTQGPAGPAGANGAPGPVGPTGPGGGATGPTGPTGNNGSAGATGAVGPAGPAGPTGLNGNTGPQGPAGANGLPGATGSPGATGATGAPGTGGVNIVSSSVTGDQTLTALAYTNVPGLSITFTPTQTTAFLNFTAAGFGYADGMSYVEFRVLVNGVSAGGTSEKVSILDSFTGDGTSPWSAAFTKKVTVNANVANTVTVQYRVAAISGTPGIGIYTTTETGHHGTISAFVQ